MISSVYNGRVDSFQTAKRETMEPDLTQRQQVHALLDMLPAEKLNAVRSLLEAMLDPNSGDEPLTEEDRRAVAASREWFKEKPEGISFEQVLADCGITLDDIKNSKGD